MFNMSMMATTLFLDMGCGLKIDPQDMHSTKLDPAVKDMERPAWGGNGLQALPLDDSEDSMLEEYLKLVISFRKQPGPYAGFWKIIPAHAEPRPEMVKLLGRLKFRYCLQIAVIGNDALTLNQYRSRNSSLRCIADYYVISRILANEISGVHRIMHMDYSSTRSELASYGLSDI